MTEKAPHIGKRFPDQTRRIDLLMTQNPEFADLCEDYDACVNALKHWQESEAPEAKTRMNEYRIIIEDLEAEIFQALQASKTSLVD